MSVAGAGWAPGSGSENRNLILTASGQVVRIDFDRAYRRPDRTFLDQLLEQLHRYPDVYGLLSPQDVLEQLGAVNAVRQHLLAIVHDGPEREQAARHFQWIERALAMRRLPNELVNDLADARLSMLSSGDRPENRLPVPAFAPRLDAIPTGRAMVVDGAGLRNLLDAGLPIAVHGMREQLQGEVWQVAVEETDA